MVLDEAASSRRLSTTVFTTPVPAVPVMSVHTVPPGSPAEIVCQTRPLPRTPSVAHASRAFDGLMASAVIRGWPVSRAAEYAGTLPVMSIQAGLTAAALFVMKILPPSLPVSSSPAVGPLPIATVLIQSPNGSTVVPVVRSPLMGLHPPEPAGRPPLVLR